MAKNKIAGRLYLYLVQIVFITISGCNNDNNGQIRLEPLNKSTGENSISVEKSIPIIDIDTTDAEKINVPKDIFQSTLDFKKLIKEFHFAGLETNDKSIIGSINKILSDSVFYFIHDKDNNKIFRFNFQGKFLNQVGTTGNGPQEFVEAWDISLDKSNNLISVLDLKGRKIVRYTYDGRYIDSNPMYFFYTQHEYDNGYLILRTGKSNNISAPLVSSFELVIAHQNQVPIKKAFPFPEKMNSYTTENPLRKFNNTIYYHHPFSNFIWMVKNKNLDAPIKLSFQKNGWPDHIWLEGLDENEFREALSKYTYFSGNYIIADKFRFFQISAHNNSAMLFQNKDSKSIQCGGSIINAKNQLHTFLFSAPQWYRDDGYFIGIKQPYELVQWRDYILKNDNNILTSEEKKILNSINESDNPIIVTYTLNNF